MICNAMVYMRMFLLHFNVIPFYTCRHMPKATHLLLLVILQHNLSTRPNRYAQRNDKRDCSTQSGELLKTSKENVPCVKVLLTVFCGLIFLGTIFRPIVFAACRAHFFATFFQQQRGLDRRFLTYRGVGTTVAQARPYVVVGCRRREPS